MYYYPREDNIEYIIRASLAQLHCVQESLLPGAYISPQIIPFKVAATLDENDWPKEGLFHVAGTDVKLVIPMVLWLMGAVRFYQR